MTRLNFRRGLKRIWIAASFIWILAIIVIGYESFSRYFLFHSTANIDDSSCPEDIRITPEDLFQLHELNDDSLRDQLVDAEETLDLFALNPNNPFREVVVNLLCFKLEEARDRQASARAEIRFFLIAGIAPPTALFLIGTMVLWIASGFRSD